jgi:hypothetical protein
VISFGRYNVKLAPPPTESIGYLLQSFIGGELVMLVPSESLPCQTQFLDYQYLAS